MNGLGANNASKQVGWQRVGRRGEGCVLWQDLVLETRLICDPWLKRVGECRSVTVSCDTQHTKEL